MSEWQPISTAPKDGTLVDLWARNLLTWNKRGERHVNKKWGPIMDWTGREYEGWNLSESYEVTHWMPLPNPPARAKE